MVITINIKRTILFWYFFLHTLYSLIEGCKNFSSLQREKKVILRGNKSLKGKKAEAEESRIDFQLTWDANPLYDVEESVDVDQGSTEPIQKSISKSKSKTMSKNEINPTPTTESTQKLMLLEVKSVTLAMRSSDDEEVRHSQSSLTLLLFTSKRFLSKFYSDLFQFPSHLLFNLIYLWLFDITRCHISDLQS